jgi:phage-related protein
MAVPSSDIKLRVTIESAADLAGVKQVDAALSAVGQSGDTAFGRVSESVAVVNKELAAVSSQGMKSLADDALRAQKATDSVASSLNSMKKPVADAHAGLSRNTQVLQDMGRIIQDMPYGIMGIGNNIQPIVESFSRAKNEAGGIKGAIGGILSSLASPAGLAMVGIPIVTSLAIAFGDKLARDCAIRKP